MSSVTTNPVVAEGSVGADASQLAESGAQIAASVASSNPVGIAIGSVDAANALVRADSEYPDVAEFQSSYSGTGGSDFYRSEYADGSGG
jgi:hypothetical protein